MLICRIKRNKFNNPPISKIIGVLTKGYLHYTLNFCVNGISTISRFHHHNFAQSSFYCACSIYTHDLLSLFICHIASISMTDYITISGIICKIFKYPTDSRFRETKCNERDSVTEEVSKSHYVNKHSVLS